MKFLFLCVVLLFIVPAHSIAQQCDIILSGTVRDYHDNSKLELATVYLKERSQTIVTKENGTFKFLNLCSGDYTIIVDHLDCDIKETRISLTQSKEITIRLEHHAEELDAIQVLADPHDSHTSSQTMERIDKKVINQYSGATLGDALSSVAGVTGLKTGNNVVKPVIHGLYGSRVAIVNNNTRLLDQEWGIEHAPNIDVNTASNIEVIKGASALRYGADAVAGTIIINPARVIRKDTLMGVIATQLQSNGRGGSTSATIQNYRNSGWYQQATLTYKKLGDSEAPDYVLSNTGNTTAAINAGAGYRSFEYGLKVNYSFYDTTLGILRASHIGNSADLVRSINSGQPTVIRDFTYDIDPPKQEVDHHTLAVSGFKRFAALGKLDLDYSLQFNNRKEFDIRRGANRGRASLDIDLTTHATAAHLEIDRYNDTTINIGVDGLYQINTPIDTGVRRLIPDYKAYRHGAFASATHNIRDNWIVDAGLRYDYYNIDADKFYRLSRWRSLGYDQQFSNFEVRVDGNQILTNPQLDYDLFAFTVGSQLDFSKHYDVSINLSTANRAPNPSELFSEGLHHALATIELGRIDLAKEQSYKINTTFHRNAGALDVSINPHINFINNYIQLVPTGIETTTRGAFPVYQYEQLDARIYGVDVSAQYDWFKKGKLISALDADELAYEVVKAATVQSTFAYLNGTDLDEDEPLIDMPPLQWENTVTFFNVMTSGFDIHIGNQFVARQSRFPDNDYVVGIPDSSGGFTDTLVEISKTPAAYNLWNAGLHYVFPDGEDYAFAKAELHLTASNILNTRYRNYLNRQRFYADDLGTNVQLQFIYNL